MVLYGKGILVIGGLILGYVLLHGLVQIFLHLWSFVDDRDYEYKDVLGLRALCNRIGSIIDLEVYDRGDCFICLLCLTTVSLFYPLIPIVFGLYCLRFLVRCSKGIKDLIRVAHKHKNKDNVEGVDIQKPKFK